MIICSWKQLTAVQSWRSCTALVGHKVNIHSIDKGDLRANWRTKVVAVGGGWWWWYGSNFWTGLKTFRISTFSVHIECPVPPRANNTSNEGRTGKIRIGDSGFLTINVDIFSWYNIQELSDGERLENCAIISSVVRCNKFCSAQHLLAGRRGGGPGVSDRLQDSQQGDEVRLREAAVEWGTEHASGQEVGWSSCGWWVNSLFFLPFLCVYFELKGMEHIFIKFKVFIPIGWHSTFSLVVS